MTWGERAVDRLVMAYYGAVLLLLLVPVLVFVLLLQLGDWIEERCGIE